MKTTQVTTATLSDMKRLARYLRGTGLNVEIGKGFKKSAQVDAPELRVREAAKFLGIKIAVKTV